MALPIWGLYMKKNYENKELGVSDGEFPEPEEMTINLDCTKPVEDPNKPKDIDDDLEDLDFQLASFLTIEQYANALTFNLKLRAFSF